MSVENFVVIIIINSSSVFVLRVFFFPIFFGRVWFERSAGRMFWNN